MTYDVAIVGAGPAGTSAATELEKHFDNILLLDRQRFPREKLCAGVLPPRILSLLTIPVELRQRILKGYRIFAPSGKFVESEFPIEGLMVERTEFDDFLLKRLKTAPTMDRVTDIKFLADCVEITGDSDVYKTKAVIAADGVNSLLRNRLGIEMDKIAVAAQMDVTLPQEVIDERIGNWFEVYYTLPQGYGWISPMKGLVKVGMGGISEEFKKDSRGHLERFLEVVKDKLEGGEKGEIKNWRIPMDGPVGTLAGDRILLAGDAGGFVFPGTGEGVYYGMKSGTAAAETIKEAFDRDMFDKNFLGDIYDEILEANGLLALRNITFLEDVLATEETAENYIKRLSVLNEQE
jgi:geranylgeranyl reductase family protein